MKKVSLFAFLIIAIPFMTACWDRYELEERANILGLAVDYADESTADFTIPEVSHRKGEFPNSGNKKLYKVTAQLAVPGKIKLGPEGGSGSGADKTSWVLETVGYTLKDAMLNLQQQLAEKLYLGHLQIVVVSGEIAEDGLTDINDFLRRDYEVRRTAWIVVTEEKASDVLETAPPIEIVPALYLSLTLDNAMRFGKISKGYIGKFWTDLADVGVDAKLPVVKVIEKNRIMLTGLAYFKGNQKVGSMSPIEIGGYLAMREKNPGGYSITVSSEDGGVYIVESIKRDAEINVNVKNGKPTAKIDVRVESTIEEETKENDLGKKKLEEIETKASEQVEEILNDLVEKWQEDQSDVLGIGARIRAYHSKYWDQDVKDEEKWRELYKEMDIQVNVRFKIMRTGMDWK